MEKSVILVLFLLSLTCPKVLGQENPFLRDFLVRWDQSKAYLLAVAEAMPEENYFQPPYPEGKSFAEQLMHIAVIIDWHAFSKFGGSEAAIRWEDFREEGKNKAQLIHEVAREFDRTKQLIEGFDPDKLDETASYGKFSRTRRQFLLLLADHVTHHRAQLIVYLRLQNIQPPNYINFQ